jgi:hypothetical protein
MPLMNLFEPLFLLLALTFALTLLAAAVMAVSGHRPRASRLIRRLFIGTAAYFAVVIGTSLVSTRQGFRVGEPLCADDWCITVIAATHAPSPTGDTTMYEVSLRLSNRSQGTPMGEKGTVVYLVDAGDRRYDPLPDGDALPFDTRLPPGQSAITVRHFILPAATPAVGLVYAHVGFPIGWLIINEGGWFQQPPIIRFT